MRKVQDQYEYKIGAKVFVKYGGQEFFGRVTGRAGGADLVKVTRDGRKTAANFHKSFVRPASQAETTQGDKNG